jgi:hypothetical protein
MGFSDETGNSIPENGSETFNMEFNLLGRLFLVDFIIPSFPAPNSLLTLTGFFSYGPRSGSTYDSSRFSTGRLSFQDDRNRQVIGPTAFIATDKGAAGLFGLGTLAVKPSFNGTILSFAFAIPSRISTKIVDKLVSKLLI